jgi:hypothetical protein
MKKFNLSRLTEINEANKYINSLAEKHAYIGIEELTLGTNDQNKYFHLIVSYFGLEYGEPADWVKQEIVKKIVCPDIFVKEITSRRTGEVSIQLRSWSDLTKPERTLVIDKFRSWSSKEAGIYIPSPNEQGFLQSLESELENNKKWI